MAIGRGFYKLRFLVETALSSEANWTFGYKGNNVQFLFVERKKDGLGVEVELSIEGDGWGKAINRAQNEVLHPMLDAIAFQRHTPMSVRNWTRVLKAERGLNRRRAIMTRDDHGQTLVPMYREASLEAQKILDQDIILPLRWLRHSYRTMPILDRFIFLWLALENLSETVLKDTHCQKCRVPAICPSCQQIPRHNASDKAKALAIIQAFNPAIDDRTFNYWWNDLRNKVFHGRSEPTLDLISALHAANQQIAPALEGHLKEHFGVELRGRSREPVGAELTVRMHYFVEFDTANSGEDFPKDLPALAQLVAHEDVPGTLLVEAKEFDDW